MKSIKEIYGDSMGGVPVSDIKWFKTKEALIEWIDEAEIRNEYSYHQKETKRFYAKIKEDIDSYVF